MKKIYSLLVLFLIASYSQAQVVISQAYGGGGNSGATFTHDFVELFNRGTTSVNIEGWSIQYASATGNFTQVTVLPDVTLQPGQYYLIQQAQGTGGTTPLPTPDLIPDTPIAMGATNFKLLLANTDEAFGTSCPSGAQVVDLIGFGTANCAEGTAAPALSNTTAGIRLFDGCQDTNDNSADFITGTPIPRNSSTTLAPCPGEGTPSVVITSPSNGAEFAPESTVTISYVINNFVVGTPGAGIDGHIHYTLTPGPSDVMVYDTDPIVLSGLASGTYSFMMELVDNDHMSLNPAVTAMVSFEIADYVEVEDLMELRDHVAANGVGSYYLLNSTPVVTYTRTTRNQKYIQDDAGAILIDDQPGVITTTFTVGDEMSNLRGTVSLFSGLLQFNPSADAVVSSSGNAITPDVVTIEQLDVELPMYESRLIRLNSVSFVEADGSTVFVNPPATNYTLTDGTDNITFRTLFAEANYIGEVIPSGAQDIYVLVGNFNGTAQVVARSLNDLTLSAPAFDAIEGLTMYPNPVNGANLFITTADDMAKTVAIYDITGKEIIHTMINNQLDVSGLNQGIYMVRITENGKTAVRKLIVQ